MRQPQLGSMSTELTAEFTHFNLVIRLSKVQQLALRLCTIFENSCGSGRPRDPSVLHFFHVKPLRTIRNFIFVPAASAFDMIHDMSI